MLAVSTKVQTLLRMRCLASCCVLEHRHLSKRSKGKSKSLKLVGQSKKKTVAYEQPRIVPPPTAKELFKPMAVEPRQADQDNLGEEIVGVLSRASIAKILVNFANDKSVENLAQMNKVTGDLYQQCMQSFTKYCLVSKPLPVTLHIVFKDIESQAGHVTDLFPFFLDHAKQVFPHIECMEDLRQISDLSDPTKWYPLARSVKRKIIFHAGPTNSGKTYHAMKSFLEAERGVYCGPLRLLAMEVYDKSNEQGVPCDLVTGETRKFANDDDSPSNHIACTVEMLNTSLEYDVAVIDEIQMLGDLQRGWSWTQALLGLAARELHVCGEETAIDLVERLSYMCGDSFEVRRYSRLTKLEYLDKELGSLDNVLAGDCIVCFSKRDIFTIMTQLRARNLNAAVIYGNLPPGTKINQSRQFNDPASSCNILVATDAIGMGLNLAIKRIIFYNTSKTSVRHDGVKVRAPLSTSQALQIAGRAGRYRTRFEEGEVTTFFKRDLAKLKHIVSLPRENIEKAGLNATVDMIELFSYHLPNASLSNLLDIFMHVSTVTDNYFMCNVEDIKRLAELLEDVPLSLRSKFTFCVAPLKVREGIPRIMFKRMAKRISEGHSLTYDWLCRALGAPFHMPRNQSELQDLEAAFNVIDIYLWLSFRFEMFDDIEEVQDLRVELDTIIQAYMKSLNTGHHGDQRELETEQNPLSAYKYNPKKSKKPKELDWQNGQTNGRKRNVPNIDSSYTKEYLFSDPSSMYQSLRKIKDGLVSDSETVNGVDIIPTSAQTVEQNKVIYSSYQRSKLKEGSVVSVDRLLDDITLEQDISLKPSKPTKKDIASDINLRDVKNTIVDTAVTIVSGGSDPVHFSVPKEKTAVASVKVDNPRTKGVNIQLHYFTENTQPQKTSSDVQDQSMKPVVSSKEPRGVFDLLWKQEAGGMKESQDDGIIVVTSSSREATIEPLRLTTDKSSAQTPVTANMGEAKLEQLPEETSVTIPEEDVTDFTEAIRESPAKEIPHVINFWAERPKAPVAKTLENSLIDIDIACTDTGQHKEMAFEDMDFADNSVVNSGDLAEEYNDQAGNIDTDLDEEIAKSLEVQQKRMFPKRIKKVEVPLKSIENIDIVKDFETALKKQEQENASKVKRDVETEVVHGKLTSRLLKERILSERILKQLEIEWEERRKRGQHS